MGRCPRKDVLITSGTKERRPRRSFSKEFKAEVVELVRSSGQSVAAVARRMDLTRDGGAGVGPPGRHRCRPSRRAHDRRTGRAHCSPQGEPGPARRAGHPQTSHGFLREGNPVNVYPFIEAEEEEQRNVKKSCVLLE